MYQTNEIVEGTTMILNNDVTPPDLGEIDARQFDLPEKIRLEDVCVKMGTKMVNIVNF